MALLGVEIIPAVPVPRPNMHSSVMRKVPRQVLVHFLDILRGLQTVGELAACRQLEVGVAHVIWEGVVEAHGRWAE